MRYESEPILNAFDIGGGFSNEENEHAESIRPITPEVIMNANHAPEVKEAIAEFDENRAAGKLTLEWNCSDARVWRLRPRMTYYANTIANGGEPTMWTGALNSDATEAGVVTAHKKCGGRLAKGEQLENGIFTQNKFELAGFISQEIDHPSVLQAGVQALRLSTMTRKEVAAMVMDHETGELQVLAIFNREDSGRTSLLPKSFFEDPQNSAVIKDENIPYLPAEELSDRWLNHLEEFANKRDQLLKDDTRLTEKLKVQNPRMINLATNMKAPEIWIPGLAGPGNIFRLTTPRDRIQPNVGEKKTIMKQLDIDTAFAQSQYVIHHAIENRGIDGAPFRDTDTFFIATSDYAISQGIALQLAQRPFAAEWLADERNKVIVAQNNVGTLSRVAEMRFTLTNGHVTAFEERDAVAA